MARASVYDAAVTGAADQTIELAIGDLLARVGQRAGVIVTAPAGAGKSHLIATTVGRLRARDLRVAVGSPTNDQAFALVGALARRYPDQTITFVPASSVELPDNVASFGNVTVARPATIAGRAGIVVATLSKFADALGRGSLEPADVLLIDEAYQANSATYYAVAGVAPTHLLVGDGGQLAPFSTMDGADRWRGLAEDPLQTSVGVLLRHHPETPVHRLPITRRLDPRAVPVARAFYPGHDFSAAVLPRVRGLRVANAGRARRSHSPLLDEAIDRASSAGWAHLELPGAPVLTADPETISTITALVRRLFDRQPEARCEHRQWSDLTQADVAVGVSHNDQKDLLRVALAECGLGGVTVDTANKLQGLQFEVVVVWHPLSGLPDTDSFHLDPGRLCVLLTRHRQACIVVGRASDRELLDGVPPATSAYLGWDPDPVLDGWEVHQTVFDELAAVRVAA